MTVEELLKAVPDRGTLRLVAQALGMDNRKALTTRPKDLATFILDAAPAAKAFDVLHVQVALLSALRHVPFENWARFIEGMYGALGGKERQWIGPSVIGF